MTGTPTIFYTDQFGAWGDLILAAVFAVHLVRWAWRFFDWGA